MLSALNPSTWSAGKTVVVGVVAVGAASIVGASILGGVIALATAQGVAMSPTIAFAVSLLSGAMGPLLPTWAFAGLAGFGCTLPLFVILFTIVVSLGVTLYITVQQSRKHPLVEAVGAMMTYSQILHAMRSEETHSAPEVPEETK